MKVYLFPYGVGRVVNDPSSREWEIEFSDGRRVRAFRVECLIWTGN